jgi:hypothetical protein
MFIFDVNMTIEMAKKYFNAEQNVQIDFFFVMSTIFCDGYLVFELLIKI